MPGGRGRYRNTRREIVVAVMVLSGTIGATLIMGFERGLFPVPVTAPVPLKVKDVPGDSARAPALEDRSTGELIRLHEQRAGRIIEDMEQMAALAASPAAEESLAGSGVSEEVKTIQRAFEALHQAYVAALGRGDQVLGHETHAEALQLLARYQELRPRIDPALGHPDAPVPPLDYHAVCERPGRLPPSAETFAAGAFLDAGEVLILPDPCWRRPSVLYSPCLPPTEEPPRTRLATQVPHERVW